MIGGSMLTGLESLQWSSQCTRENNHLLSRKGGTTSKPLLAYFPVYRVTKVFI